MFGTYKDEVLLKSRLSRPMSPMPDFEEDEEEVNNVNKSETSKVESSKVEENIQITEANSTNLPTMNNISPTNVTNSQVTDTQTNLDDTQNSVQNITKNDSQEEKSDTEKIEVDPVLDLGERDDKVGIQRDVSMDTIADTSAQSTMNTLTYINVENCGIPLSLFTKGYLCLPYLSLPYIDLLADVNVRGYVVGATNVLFKQKKQLADVLVEIDGTRIESQDPDLRRQLHLTTEDLRFADFIVKHVSEEKHDVFLDGVGWEGGDEWIRAQFRVYLLCLLRTSLLQGKKLLME